MNAMRWGAGLSWPLLFFVPASGQSVATAPEGRADFQAQRMTPSRILAGLHGYPDQVVDALVRLAETPQELERAAEAVQGGRDPLADSADTPAQLREGLELLARTPEILLLVATHPEELQALRSLWSVAPQGAALRLHQLRDGYAQAAREAALAWQRTLESDPVALGEYRELLTRFCEAERKVAPGFACIRITDRSYYYACPPNEALILFADGEELPRSLWLVLAGWWKAHAPQLVDAELARMRVIAPAAVEAGDFVYDWPAERRAAMWQPVEADERDYALGLVPVILQPPADQPPAAQLARAVMEHARLWSSPMPAVALHGPDVESRPASDAEQPVIVIEEPIRGPQTARRDEEVVYGDITYQNRWDYVLPWYAGLSYGYSVTGPYYCGPNYYSYPGVSVGYPSAVYYSSAPYYSSGVYLRGGHLGFGARVHGSRRYGRIHYGGGRHYGNTSISVGSRRSDYRRPRAYLSTRDRRHRTHAYRPHSSRPVLRHRSLLHRRSLSHVRRSSSGTRGIRAGIRARSTALREAYRSRGRAIRGGLRPGRSSTRLIRTTPRSSVRAIRPSSRSSGRGSRSGVRGRIGGVRRR
ncbi:MAG: hypothetical protein ACE5I3_04010 [Phycisphaerae bacterium]